MCGIAGLMTRDGRAPDPALLDRMEAALAHRGPDGARRLIRGDTALLHLRLAIVDLETGDQPLFGAGPDDTRIALIANGEIYNDPDLRREMTATPFATRSDCEPAVHLYASRGLDYADALRGMYAIAIHDPARGRLVLSRDPFGIKPLYVAATDSLFGFASEPGALIAAGLVRPAVDPTRRAELMQIKFTTGPETIWPGIARVLPGETLVVEGGAIVERRRREALPAGRPLPIRRADAAPALERVLLDSVTAHLRADVPYGLFLSGGIDSASLLALMRRATGSRIHAITVGWEGGEAANGAAGVADESREAERLARIAGADCHRVVMTQADFWALAPRMVAAIDDPTTDAAVLPTWLLGRTAREDGLKVALSGEGADELFGGYARYRKRRAPLRWITGASRRHGLFRDDGALADWRDGLTSAHARAGGDGRTPMQAEQAADVAEWLPNDLLIKLDRCLMTHGVEGRTPFLDPVVAQFAFRLPDARKAGLRLGKVLLRTWLEGAFPEAGAWARKKGFKPPVGRWMAARADMLGARLAHHPAIASILPAEAVTGAFATAEDQPQRSWSLLFYALWYATRVLGADPNDDVETVLAAS